jgi:tetratricopeptide (TPR) repeat protein
MRRLLLAVVAPALGAAIFLAAAAGLAAPGAGTGAGTGADDEAAGPPGTSITALQHHLRQQPRDTRSWATLGLTYVERARASGDPTYYPKAEGAVDRALALTGDDDLALAAAGALAAARHDFSAALRLGDRAATVNPYSVLAQTVRTDALVELGRYDQADAAARRADELQPGLPTFSRLSYLAELRGDTNQATALLQRSLGPATTPADAAFLRFHLGELARGRGDYRLADRQYAAALAAAPSFVPALAGRARVAAALGHTRTAVERYSAVVSRLPLPEYLTEFGELFESVGRRADAQEQYDVVRSTVALARANGVGTDLELALFEADHGGRAAALRAARAEWNRRHSIHVADALAWALHVNGRDAEALRYARMATALGTRDARLLYHRGVIEHAVGRPAQARRSLAAALALNPHFSPLRAARAQAILGRLS